MSERFPARGMLPDDLTIRGRSSPAMEAGAVAEREPVPEAAMTKERIKKAQDTLLKYKNGKHALEQRIVQNEEWWRLRVNRAKKCANERLGANSSAWLFNMVHMKVSDYADNLPDPIITPREQSDAPTAAQLTKIIPVILERSDYEDVYLDAALSKIKHGTGCKGVFWDATQENGLGEVVIKEIDLLNLFWEPGISELQDTPNLFHVALRDNDALKRQYPDKDLKLGGKAIDIKEYSYDDNVDTSSKSVVIDWYYKTTVGTRVVLHLCQFVNDVVLYSSEDDPQCAERGIYDHGKYPFVMDSLFPMKGSPAGFGFLDVAIQPQEYIDRIDWAIMQNTLSNANSRWYAKTGGGGVNEEEYLDFTRPIVHVEGSIDENHLRQIPNNALPQIYMNVRQEKINELKETTGNRDFNQGGTTGGVTAMGAIGALIETGNKSSRGVIRASHRAFQKEIMLLIELIRQFYQEPRKYRILGQFGLEQFIAFSNAGMQPEPQGNDFGIDMGLRMPVYDVSVRSQKSNPFTTQGQDEKAIQFFGMGFFNPQMSDQALACLEMMSDFEGKDQVQQRIAQNGTMYQQLMQMAAILQQMRGGGPVQQGPSEEGPPEPPTAEQIESSEPPDPGGSRAKMEKALASVQVGV